jgi:hypothetical protein
LGDQSLVGLGSPISSPHVLPFRVPSLDNLRILKDLDELGALELIIVQRLPKATEVLEQGHQLIAVLLLKFFHVLEVSELFFLLLDCFGCVVEDSSVGRLVFLDQLLLLTAFV